MLSASLLFALCAAPGVSSPPAATPAGPLLLQGVLSAPRQGALVDVARQYVLEHATELGLSPDSTLGDPKTFGTRFGGSVHFPQRFAGLPLRGASVVVTFDGMGRIVRVASSLSDARVVRGEATVDAARARALAARAVDMALLQADGTPFGGFLDVAFLVQGEVHRGYWVWVPTPAVGENWHVAIDATDGAVLFTENRVHASFAADVFDPAAPSVGPVGVAARRRVTLSDLPADAGTLTGNRVRVWGCCPTAGCQLNAPARRVTGSFQTGQGSLPYDMVVCDRLQTATNELAAHPSGDFVYPAIDPPTTARPSAASAADWDAFSEVMGYFHVTKVYDTFEALSRGPLASDAGTFSPYVQRDNRQGRPFATWVNVTEPDFETATRDAAGIVANDLARVSNALFLPREQMGGVTVPQNAFESDALVIYQGDEADFAYDGPVLWHEFGHGLVYSTSDWNRSVAIDEWSANNESAALHESVADIVAFMTGNEPAIGTYVSALSQSGSSLRSANNTFACPDVLEGQSHADSQHFTGAVWEARVGPFRSPDDGRTFDAAFYAALVSFPKNVDFAAAARIVANAVGLAFPALPNAEQTMLGIFRSRGVVGCSKVIDVTDRLGQPRALYGIVGTRAAGLVEGSLVPGPHQFKLRLPRGAKSLSFTSELFTFGRGEDVQLLTKVGRPISFLEVRGSLGTNAELTVTASSPAPGRLQGSTPLRVDCGRELYFTLGNRSERDLLLADVAFRYEQLDSCPSDAGAQTPTSLQLAPETLGTVPTGCGCSAGFTPGFALLALVAWRRRTRR